MGLGQILELEKILLIESYGNYNIQICALGHDLKYLNIEYMLDNEI